MSDKRFLDRVYKTSGSEAMERLYDDWADSYDAELAEAGYATPARCARAMVATGCTGPVLDVGCGTGLSGRAMAAAGLSPIDGTDLSAGMLEVARRTGVYRRLWQQDAEKGLEVTPGSYATIAAVGVISPGAAPAALLDNLLGLLPPGGRLAFSFNDHALADSAYTGALGAALESGRARQLFAENGPHIPAESLQSTVYVLERA